jgi:hypothetical protein
MANYIKGPWSTFKQLSDQSFTEIKDPTGLKIAEIFGSCEESNLTNLKRIIKKARGSQ